MIKAILANLSKDNKKQLMVAFEGEFSQHIRINTTHFIGINVIPNARFQILETCGNWSYGVIHENS